MVKNRSLARAISDAAWRQFRTMLEYKTDWHGRNLIVVDRWFPSSKLCSGCGVLVEQMPLNVQSVVKQENPRATEGIPAIHGGGECQTRSTSRVPKSP
jgi:transposase